MRKISKIFAVLLLLLILFRGWIYRASVKYNTISTRAEIPIRNQELLDEIQLKTRNIDIDFNAVIQIASSITKKELSFSFDQSSSDPNLLMTTKQANCVGYAAMFNSIANYLIKQNDLGDKIEVKHEVAQLKFLGIDIHQYFDSSFFNDHDFNTIRNLQQGTIIAIDPSVSDYLKISKVSL